LRPVIDWLDARGFFKDTRAFRSVLRLLERSGRADELLSRVSDDFVDLAVRECQLGDAVRDNLAAAARVASKARNWPVLARLVELARAAETLYEWRFDDFSLAEAYGLAFGTLFGGKRLVGKLLHGSVHLHASCRAPVVPPMRRRGNCSPMVGIHGGLRSTGG
jgi:hypothetical protein